MLANAGWKYIGIESSNLSRTISLLTFFNFCFFHNNLCYNFVYGQQTFTTNHH